MKFNATVHVFRKHDVLNPEEPQTLQALHKLGFKNMESIKMGKVFCVTVESSDRVQAEGEVYNACHRLLVNMVTDTFHIEQIKPAT